MCHYNGNSSIGYRPFPGTFRPLPWRPQPRPGTEYHRNLPDQRVGNWWNTSPFNRNTGYVIDQNHNGRYDRGQDGVLVFDTNRDGKYDQRDVASTNDMMKAAGGNYDFDGDGRVSCCERRRGAFLRHQYARLDRNRDGRLDTHEIAAGGGKVWVDKSRGGGISQNELHSPYNIPGKWYDGCSSRRLDSVDPIWGSRTSRNRNWWNPPFPGPRPFPPCFGHGGHRYGYQLH